MGRSMIMIHCSRLWYVNVCSVMMLLGGHWVQTRAPFQLGFMLGSWILVWEICLSFLWTVNRVVIKLNEEQSNCVSCAWLTFLSPVRAKICARRFCCRSWTLCTCKRLPEKSFSSKFRPWSPVSTVTENAPPYEEKTEGGGGVWEASSKNLMQFYFMNKWIVSFEALSVYRLLSTIYLTYH